MSERADTRPVLVLGLGNPILRDDGVGWRVVEMVESRLCLVGTAETVTTDRVRVEFDCVALGGLALMERLVGYERAVLVDAIQTRQGHPGAVYRLGLGDLPTLNADAVHDATLKAALELGRGLGAELPDDITIIAVEAADVLNFGEGLSPIVEAAVPVAAELVLQMLCDANHHHEGANPWLI
jgi:hydrogenase maturation protease